MDSSSKEKISHSALVNTWEGSPNAHHHSLPHHRHHNLNRALLFKVPRHNYNVQHSQRNLGHHAATSTSRGKTNHSSKFGHRFDSRSGYAERREKSSQRLERIRSNALVIDVLSPDARKMQCGLCSVSASDISVVAVLFCGHVFHAECLETRTAFEDRRDPPCPLCMTTSHSAN